MLWWSLLAEQKSWSWLELDHSIIFFWLCPRTKDKYWDNWSHNKFQSLNDKFWLTLYTHNASNSEAIWSVDQEKKTDENTPELMGSESVSRNGLDLQQSSPTQKRRKESKNNILLLELD